MKIHVYVDRSDDGYLRATAESKDIELLYDLPKEMTTRAKEYAKELLYKIEREALDHVTQWELESELPLTVTVVLGAKVTEYKD